MIAIIFFWFLFSFCLLQNDTNRWLNWMCTTHINQDVLLFFVVVNKCNRFRRWEKQRNNPTNIVSKEDEKQSQSTCYLWFYVILMRKTNSIDIFDNLLLIQNIKRVNINVFLSFKFGFNWIWWHKTGSLKMLCPNNVHGWLWILKAVKFV